MKSGIIAGIALALSGTAMNFSWAVVAQGTSEVTMLLVWGTTLLLLGRNARVKKNIVAAPAPMRQPSSLGSSAHQQA